MCKENEVNTEKNIMDEEQENSRDEIVTIFKKGGRTYYTTRKEVEAVRRKGDRIFYSKKEKAYYIRRVNKPFWGW